ncbi:MAG TPA: choice-of-anchor M domain-containing protein [Solirubrobacteraceae bacterium]|nr:choice-of-anchor M domain-containing protein [Solirubrobacteraceae bacterium]
MNHAVARTAALLTAVVAIAGAAGPGAAQAQDAAAERGLEQTIEREQTVADGRKVLSDGHVDIGPRFVDGRWTLLVHDDAAKADSGAKSVWRPTDDTVLEVSDAAILEVPDDPAYEFLRAAPGSKVHVVPQTQDPDVVWVGWNTQDPEVMERIDRGVTMTLTGVQGPGSLVVYLQSGTFGDPQVLWDSEAKPKPAWVDVNTHTHANWVFSKPGVYLVRVRIEADLVDGTKVRDTRALRFAVGSTTSADDAFAASWSGPAEEPSASVAAEADGEEDDDGFPIVPVTGVALLALVLLGAVGATVRRGARAKRQARA